MTKGGAVYSTIPAVDKVIDPTEGDVISSKLRNKSIPNWYSLSKTPAVRSLVLTSASFTLRASPCKTGQSLTGLTQIVTRPVAKNPSLSVIL